MFNITEGWLSNDVFPKSKFVANFCLNNNILLFVVVRTPDPRLGSMFEDWNKEVDKECTKPVVTRTTQASLHIDFNSDFNASSSA